ncbi:MAG: hypothetical protein ACI9J4_001625 [Paraglaciecola sp.]|jgi:hypothetical protein
MTGKQVERLKEALPFLVAIISKNNEVKLKEGRPTSPITTNFILQIIAVAEVFELANKYRLDTYLDRGGEAPLEKAKNEVARKYRVSPSTIRDFIRKHGEDVKSIHDEHIQ